MKIKIIIAVLLSVGLCIASSVLSVKAEEDANGHNNRVESAREYAEGEIYKFLSSLDPNSEFYYANGSDLTLADPYIIYMAGQDTQDEAYSFPVYDKKTGKVIYVADVFSAVQKDGFMCNFGMAYSELFDRLDYINHPENVIVYRIGYSVFYEKRDQVFDDYGNTITVNVDMSEKEKAFVQLSFEEKKEAVNNRLTQMAPAKPVTLSEEEAMQAKMRGYLTLYNPRFQYNYGMCWACAVATTYNYLYTASITGFDVCNAMGIGYNAGGSIIDEKDALNLYGVVYNNMRYFSTYYNPMSYSNIVTNIDYERPLIMNGSSNSGNHAVTIYGYNGSSGASYNIMYFDSAYPNILSAKRMCTWTDGCFYSNGVTMYYLSWLSSL